MVEEAAVAEGELRPLTNGKESAACSSCRVIPRGLIVTVDAVARQSPCAARHRFSRRLALGVEAIGRWLQARQDIVRLIQWIFVLIYLLLLVGPVLLPTAPGTHVSASLARLAEALFWGLWWPGVLLSTMLFGQIWCGLLCPDGRLTETASRVGRGGKIPAALRWAGWPLLLFTVVSVIEHLSERLSGVRHSPTLTLLVVGGSSLLAILTGLLFGRGKRIWCRFLCPLSAAFSLLARCAVVHIRVDRTTWDTAPRPLPRAVDCPLLLDVRRLRSNEKCNMCGRCVGHRQAVAMSLRRPGAEIVGIEAARAGDAAAIVFVLIGLAWAFRIGGGSPLAIHWPASMGLGNLCSVLLSALVAGSAAALVVALAGLGSRQRSLALAYCLIPVGGMLLSLTALEFSLAILRREGFALDAVADTLRVALPALGAFWSALLAAAQLRAGALSRNRRWAATAIFVVGVVGLSLGLSHSGI